MSLKKCPVCGKEFEAKGSQKYCSPRCVKAGTKKAKHAFYIKHKIEAVKAEGAKEEALEELDKLEALVERATKLDRKLEELHSNGKSYADAQKAETIKQFARVEIPEEFKGTACAYTGKDIETPEASKMLEVFVDPDLIDDEELAKGGLGGHGPTFCITTPQPEKPAERKKIMYIDSETREFLSELKGALNVIGAVSGNEIIVDIICEYIERIDKTLKGEEAVE